MAATKQPRKKPGPKGPAPLSWWVDETVPEIRDILPPAVNHDLFVQWLGPRLGIFREAENARAAIPTRAYEARAMKHLASLLRQTKAAMRSMPPRSAANFHLLLHQYSDTVRVGAYEFERRLHDDLLYAGAIIPKVVQRLLAHEGKRGRKKEAARDELLAAIVEKLRDTPLGADIARATAIDILNRCRIRSPGLPESARKAGRRGKK